MMYFLLMFVLMGCLEKNETEKIASGLHCANSADCTDGELCVEDSCQIVDCVTSLDCEIEEFCNGNYKCKAGCTEDNDCYAGDECNTESKECESYGCRNTELDCGISEFCNPATAECYSDGIDYCSLCTTDDIYSMAPVNGTCLIDDSSGSCQVNGYAEQSGCSNPEICFPDDVEEWQNNSWLNPGMYSDGTCYTFYKYIYVSILAQGECPGGFSDVAIQYSDGSSDENGPVCYGDCAFYKENGYID